MNDLVSQKIVQIADSLQTALIAKGPVAVQLLFVTARIQALSNVIGGLIFFLLTTIVLVFINRVKIFTTGEKLFFSAVVLMSGFLVMGALGLFDLFNWVGIWHPDIYIAHELINKVVG